MARQRLVTRLLAVLCGLALLAVGGWGWAHRQDLKRWLLWWEVRRLGALRERDPEAKAFQRTENRGLSPFDVAFSRLVRRQRPEFLGGCNVRLFPLRGRHGKPVVAAVYEPMQNDFALPEGTGPEVVSFCCCSCKELKLLVLDGSGTVLGDPRSEKVWMEKYITRVASRGAYDVLQLLCMEPIFIWRRGSCLACAEAQRGDSPKEFSADSAGLADHGRVASDVPGSPACGRAAHDERSRVDPAEVANLLASGTGADAHRALTALESGDSRRAALVEPLLRHEEPLVRARAAVIASRVPELRENVLSLLDDPDPGVRAGAIIGARRYPGWEAALLHVAQEPDAALARRARLELSHSTDPGYARPALLQLLRDREEAALHRDNEHVANGELPHATLAWLEFSRESVLAALAPRLEGAYSREILLDRIDGILTLARRVAPEGQERCLIDLLAKLDDPRADDMLVGMLDDARDSDRVSRIIEALLVRGTPIRAAAATEVLVDLLREDDPCGPYCKENVALLLMRRERMEGFVWMLWSLELEEGEFFPMTSFLSWIAPPSVEPEEPVSEVPLNPWARHTNW